MQAQKTIVIHPGSLYVRIGRAADLNPVCILHAIAHKRNLHADKTKSQSDRLLPPIQHEAQQEFEEHRLQVSHAIQSLVSKGDGRKRLRVATPPQQIATFNRTSLPEVLNSSIEADDSHYKVKPENVGSKTVLFDQQLLQLSSSEAAAYDIHFPMRRGELHLHSGLGGSMVSILGNLEAIWLYAIRDRMGISPSELLQYAAVLVVPDIYNRSHLRELVSLLLQRLGFRACFLLQDHVAATFGGGLGYACVVDIGDQKCSVSCVDDGISQTDTRVRLAYGGGDVTQVFQMLLRKCCFPYRECNVDTDYADAALLMDLKERFCHMSFDVSGAQEKTFEITKRGKHLRYTLQLGDECIVAPLSLFHTELLNITGKQKEALIPLRSGQQPDFEDCFDAEYIRETGRRNGRDQLLEGTLPVVGEGADDELVAVDAYEAVDRENIAKFNDKEELCRYMPNGQIVPIDQAIVRSIECCGTEEMKRKMYGCILLVGGGSKFPGFSKWLEHRVSQQLAAIWHHREGTQPQYEVNAYMKEMDASMISWKGSAIMSCLESAAELWIHASEWEKYGLRVLREKAPFLW